MTAQGNPRVVFRRALERGNLLVAETTAREVGVIDLREALELTALIAKRDPRVRGRRVAARWLRRGSWPPLCQEPSVGTAAPPTTSARRARLAANGLTSHYPTMTCRGVLSLFVVISATALQVGVAVAQTPVATLKLGDVRTFNSTKLRPGDTLVCVGNGRRISAKVPPFRLRSSGVFTHSGAAGALTPRLDPRQPLHLLISTIANDAFLVTCI